MSLIFSTHLFLSFYMWMVLWYEIIKLNPSPTRRFQSHHLSLFSNFEPCHLSTCPTILNISKLFCVLSWELILSCDLWICLSILNCYDMSSMVRSNKVKVYFLVFQRVWTLLVWFINFTSYTCYNAIYPYCQVE
jgi:hypothetical protein